MKKNDEFFLPKALIETISFIKNISAISFAHVN